MTALHASAVACLVVWAVVFVLWSSRWAYKFLGFGHD